jgi:hypothetical protein
MNQNNNLSNQFPQEDDDPEGHYKDFHVRKGNRKSSHDRQEKKQLRKFSKYDN